MEHVVVVVGPLLLVDHDHPVVLHCLPALEDGADWRQRRHVPLDVAARVVDCVLNDRLAGLDMQDFEGHLAVWICAKVTGTKVLRVQKTGSSTPILEYESAVLE